MDGRSDASALITGGTGFVGSWLRKLAPCDVVSLSSRDAMPDGDFSHVLHCAVAYDIGTDIPLTVHAMEHAERIGARFIFMSSGAVGFLGDDYSVQKAALERMVVARGGTVARLYTFIGVGINRWLAPYQFALSAIETGRIEIAGTGNTVRSYLHGSDMAEAVWSIADTPGIHEIGSCEPVTIRELAGEVAKVTGAEVIVHGGDDGARPVYLPSEGITPRIPLAVSVAETVEWVRREQRPAHIGIHGSSTSDGPSAS